MDVAVGAVPAPDATPFGRVLAIGDSVMQGAGPELYGSLPLAIPGIVVDAVPSRQFWHAGDVIDAHLAASDRPDRVVLHLGTNGLPSERQIDDVLGAVGDTPIVIVNIRAPRAWEAETNRRLASAVDDHRSAVLVDWWALTDGNDGWLKRDGFHLSRAGAVPYALHIARAVAAVSPAADADGPRRRRGEDSTAPIAVSPFLSIHPRAAWARTTPSVHPAAEDPRVLVVHHSAGASPATAEDTPAMLRSMLDHHTGSERGWPDVAYNFVIDPHGYVWEGRAGSLDGPVVGDATGGNQGFGQLICVLGNFTGELPTGAALDALARTVAWLAERDQIDIRPGAVAEFDSRGSSRWPIGERVEVPTIAGHRDLSRTACPGDALYDYVMTQLPRAAAAYRHRPPGDAG